jgi:citronellol/citronellal dehydrogenase
MGIFRNKTVIITGGSRGIGREMAIKLGSEGANVVLAAKTKEPHRTLSGTIDSVAEEVTAAGGSALPVQTDVRDADAISSLIEKTVSHFGGVDIVINNAGAIYLTDTLSTDAKQYDLMQGINARATFLMSRAAIPYLKKKGGHILNMSPPISLEPRWLAPHVAYSISKFGMSMCTLGMAEELKEYKIAVNSLWPKTIIYTAAITRLMGEDSMKNCRRPSIIADAASWILSQDPSKVSGNLFLDEEVMKKAGVNDLEPYSFVPNAELVPDIYVS